MLREQQMAGYWMHGNPKTIDAMFPCLARTEFARSIDAAFSGAIGSGQAYLFKGDSCVLLSYDYKNLHVHPQDCWVVSQLEEHHLWKWNWGSFRFSSEEWMKLTYSKEISMRYSTSALILHMMTTSLVVWSLSLQTTGPLLRRCCLANPAWAWSSWSLPQPRWWSIFSPGARWSLRIKDIHLHCRWM